MTPNNAFNFTTVDINAILFQNGCYIFLNVDVPIEIYESLIRR